MSSVGRLIRDAREQRGVSLDQVEKQTKIPLKVLQAIEADDLSQISTAFLYRSFVRQIAGAVRLDYTVIESQVLAATSAIPEPRMPGQDHPALKLAPIRPRRQTGWRWAAPFLSLAVVLVVCSVTYANLDNLQLPDFWALAHHGADAAKRAADSVATYASDRLNREDSTAKAVAPQSAQPQAPRTQSEPKGAATVAASNASPKEEQSSAISLKIAAVEKVWLAINADGKPVYSGLLEAQDTKELRGRETATIYTGNVGGLSITFNGKQLGRLGPHGQVRTVLFRPDQYEIVPPRLSAQVHVVPALFAAE